MEVARLLLAANADKDKAMLDGATPLFIAAQKGQLEVARLLLEANANMDKAAQDGTTPFFVAASYGQLEVVRLLLEASADMDKATHAGATPLFIAAQKGHVEADELLLCMGLLGCSKGRSTDLAFRFDFPHFKRVAMVVVGEPPEVLRRASAMQIQDELQDTASQQELGVVGAFKAKAHAVLLAEKQEKLDAEWKVRQADKERQRQLESLRAQQLALQEQQRKAAEAAKAEAAESAEGASSAEAKDEEMKEEGAEVKEEAKEDAEMQMKEEPKEEPEAPPVAELDEEESRLWFLPRSTTDMVSVTFNSTFADFTLPDETENFSEIRYEWAGEVASKDYMKSWMQAKKITTRVEELFPDDTFTNRVLEWQRVQGDWQYRQKEFKTDPVRQQAANTRMEKEKKYQEKLNKPKLEAQETEGAEGAAE
ncbi:ASB3, partial [Symbiodinium sp. KB8]